MSAWHASFRAFPTYTGTPICVWRSRTIDGRELFSCNALLQHKLYKHFSCRIVKTVPERFDSLGMWRSCLAQIKNLVCPANIQLLSIPPYTPEMNPIEQIWKQIRSMGFRNEIFHSLADVVDRLCETICCLTKEMVKRITGCDWIIQCFRWGLV